MYNNRIITFYTSHKIKTFLNFTLLFYIKFSFYVDNSFYYPHNPQSYTQFSFLLSLYLTIFLFYFHIFSSSLSTLLKLGINYYSINITSILAPNYKYFLSYFINKYLPFHTL